VRYRDSSSDGRNIYDAAALGAHMGPDEQVQDKWRPKMQAHGAIEILELHMLDWADFDNAGVVDQDVDLAEALKRLLDSGLDLRGLEQIALNREDFSRETIQVRFRSRELFSIARKESDFSSARTNLTRDFQPEPARAAGDESDFVAI
jgi:hypothetical protein